MTVTLFCFGSHPLECINIPKISILLDALESLTAPLLFGITKNCLQFISPLKCLNVVLIFGLEHLLFYSYNLATILLSPLDEIIVIVLIIYPIFSLGT